MVCLLLNALLRISYLAELPPGQFYKALPHRTAGGAGLTFVVLEALGRGAAAPRVVRRLLPPVVPGVDVAAKLDEHLDEVHVLHLGRVMQGCLVQLCRIHVGPCGSRAEKNHHQRENWEPRETGAWIFSSSTVCKSNPGPGNKIKTDCFKTFLKIQKQ